MMEDNNIDLPVSSLVNFTHDRNLFVGIDDEPIEFQMRPCTERSRIAPMIEHGGGVISNKTTPDCIRLAVRGTIVLNTKTVATDFIDECVKKNRLLHYEDFYVVKVLENDDTSDEEFNAKPKKKQEVSFPSRRDYTLNEDKQILQYICSNNLYSQVKGNSIWKDMEDNEIVEKRSWQSMKDHFRRKLLSQLNHYKLTATEKLQLLTTLHTKRKYHPIPKPKSKKKNRDKEKSDRNEESGSSGEKPGKRRLASKKCKIDDEEEEDEGNSVYTIFKGLRSRTKRSVVEVDPNPVVETIDEHGNTVIDIVSDSSELMDEDEEEEELFKKQPLVVLKRPVEAEIAKASTSKDLSHNNEVQEEETSESKRKKMKVTDEKQGRGDSVGDFEKLIKMKRSAVKTKCLEKFRKSDSKMSEANFSLLLSGMPKLALVQTLVGDVEAQLQNINDICANFPSSSDEDSLSSDNGY